MKATILLLDSDFTGRIIRRGVSQDGKLRYKTKDEDKEWDISKAKPFNLQTFFSSRPLYICKWNSLYPLQFDIKDNSKEYVNAETGEKIKIGGKELVVISPDDLKFKESHKDTPEMLAGTHDQRFLKHMRKYAGGREGMQASLFPILMALIFGAIMAYILIAMKIIPV
jgi:hypothetical protein